MQRMIRMCLNWRVIGGLAMVGLGVWLAAPDLLAAALPVLLLAVCPLSMLLMVKAMDGGHHTSQPGDAKIEDRVAPSREVRIAELRAQREVIDSVISALEEEPDPPGAPPLPSAHGPSSDPPS